MPTKPSAAARMSAVPLRRGNGAISPHPGPQASGGKPAGANGNGHGARPEPKILFQKYFKSVGPRTYASQVKECANGNHLLVLTEGKRDPQTGEVRKTRVFVYSEDFAAYFRMLHETAQFIKTHPVPEAIKMKRMRHWARKEADAVTAAREAAATAKPIAPTKVVTSAKAPAGKPVAARTTNKRPARR